MGIVIYLFRYVNLESIEVDKEKNTFTKNEKRVTEPLLGSNTEIKENVVGLIEAWRIPKVHKNKMR